MKGLREVQSEAREPNRQEEGVHRAKEEAQSLETRTLAVTDP